MSSRSNGVTKVRFKRLITSWVRRSPSCSAARMSRSEPRFSGQSLSSSTSRREISRAFAAAWLNRVKNSRFCGVRRSGTGGLCHREVERRGESGQEAVDRERRQRLRLEEAHQEAHG